MGKEHVHEIFKTSNKRANVYNFDYILKSLLNLKKQEETKFLNIEVFFSY
jgi:hypothetical protein